MANKYINQLDSAAQKGIKKDVKAALMCEGYRGKELQKHLTNALDGRLFDIGYLINIHKYKN